MAEPDSAFSRAVRDFARGLFEASPVSWIGIMAFCLAELVACCVLAVPRRLARLDPRYLMESQSDDYCSLTIRLMKLRFSRLDELQVVYVGGSQATRALVTRDPTRLGRELTRATGAPAAFNVMSGNNQRYEDALGIVDQFPPSYRGAFVMMVSDYKDDYPANSKRLKGMRNRIAFTDVPSLLPFWLAEGSYTPRNTGVFFLDHLGFFASRRKAAIRFSKVPGTGMPGVGGIKPAKQREALEKLTRQRAEIEKEGPNPVKRLLGQRAPLLSKSRQLMTKLIATVKDKGIIPIFVEYPHQPMRHEIFEERNDRFQREFRQFAERRGAVYLDLNPEMELTVKDFQDYVHLGSTRARRQFQRALMRHLGPLLHRRFVDGSADDAAAAQEEPETVSDYDDDADEPEGDEDVEEEETP